MNSTRYQDLLGRLFEGDLAAEEADELARALNENPSRRQDLRQHLVLWEMWSQDQSPERSAEAFLRAWKTRLRAEDEGAEAFAAAVRAEHEIRYAHCPAEDRLESRARTFGARPAGMSALRNCRRAVRDAIQRPVGIAWAVSLALVGLLVFLWLAVHPSAQAAITIQGDAMCIACAFHEGREHWPALRFASGHVTRFYYLDHNQLAAGLFCCDGPVPVVVQGYPRMEKKRLWFKATAVTLRKLEKPQEQLPKEERILFPI